jgi:hypothetical protein
MAPMRGLEGPVEVFLRGNVETRMKSLDTHGCMLPRIDDAASREVGISGPRHPEAPA